MEIRCTVCGKKITPGNRLDGLPNGVGFELDDGTIVNVCTDCVMKEGESKNADKKDE